MVKKMDLNQIVDEAGRELAATVTRQVLATLRPAIDKILAENAEFGFTEEALAAKLGISTESLARKRKAGEIGCSWAIQPTRFNNDGRPLNGRPIYLRHHVLNYLRRNETPAKVVGKEDVTFENVYEFKQQAA